MAEDVESFLTTHSLKNSTLIGHSMGAKTAMTVALRQRVPISALIPVDNAPVDAALKSDFAKYVQAMRRIEDARVTKQSDADAMLAEIEPNLAIRQFLLTNLVRDKVEGGTQKFRVPVRILAAALDNMADFPFKDPDQARWEGPTLFVRGTKSHYVADETLPIIGRFFPRFKITDVDSGHWVISEKPEEFRQGLTLPFIVQSLFDQSLTCLYSCRGLPKRSITPCVPDDFARSGGTCTWERTVFSILMVVCIPHY